LGLRPKPQSLFEKSDAKTLKASTLCLLNFIHRVLFTPEVKEIERTLVRSKGVKVETLVRVWG